MQSTTLELSRGERIKAAAKAALPYSAPMIAGFLFLGIAYGVYMKAIGFGVLYPMLMALLIYAGSVEFIAAGALVAPLFAVKRISDCFDGKRSPDFLRHLNAGKIRCTPWQKTVVFD